MILIDKTKTLCYYMGVNKSDSQIQTKITEKGRCPMVSTTKHFKKRDAILECLRSTDCHPTAETVHEMLHETHPDISLATVYRNLALFKKQGLIISVGTVNGSERFDGNPLPHVHFICTGCGKVLDLHDMEIPEGLPREAERLSNCQVHSCQISFTGLCPACSQN